jgi:hypothetical protein
MLRLIYKAHDGVWMKWSIQFSKENTNLMINMAKLRIAWGLWTIAQIIYASDGRILWDSERGMEMVITDKSVGDYDTNTCWRDLDDRVHIEPIKLEAYYE